MKVFLFALCMCPLIGPLHAQSTAEETKCFPSGYSLIDARFSSTGDYVCLTNVNYVYKTFDTRSLRPVYATKEGKDAYPAKYYPPGQTPSVLYHLTVKNLGTERNVPKLLKVEDAQGRVVSEYTTKNIEHHFFNGVSGALLVSERDGMKLQMPGKKDKRIAKEEYPWGMFSYPTFSPDGMYVVSCTGDLVNVADGSMRRGVFKGEQNKAVVLAFNTAAGSFSIGIKDVGVVSYDLKTGKELRRIPIPADLPRIDGFEVLPSPNGEDFLYWLHFYNKAAAGGLAYWVHNGKGTSLCDPLWQQEHDENFTRMLNEAVARKEQEELARKRAEEDAARRSANTIDHSTADMGGYVPSSSESSQSAKEKPVQMVTCGACYGDGYRATSTTTHRQISAPTYRTHSSGYADRVSSGQSTSSTTTTKTRCAVCGGSGKVPKR